jgi:hypothetical protein
LQAVKSRVPSELMVVNLVTSVLGTPVLQWQKPALLSLSRCTRNPRRTHFNRSVYALGWRLASLREGFLRKAVFFYRLPLAVSGRCRPSPIVPCVVTCCRHVVSFRSYLNIDNDGITIRIPKSLYHPRHIGHSLAKSAHRLRNRVVSSLWPIPLPVVGLIVVAFAAFVTQQPLESWWRSGPVANALWSYDSLMLSLFCPSVLCRTLPTPARIAYLAAIAALMTLFAVMLVQRLLLRVLLAWHGWMFERRPSALTKVWGGMLKVMFLSGRKPLLFRYVRASPSAVL